MPRPIGCTSEHTNTLIKRAMWLFIFGTVAIICVLIWYGSRLERTTELQARLENARRIDGHMRSMLHEIYTRASSIRSSDPHIEREILAIVDASDTAMRLRSFYVVHEPEDEP